jgi:8-oxo-dGTP diphosphatase
MPLREDLHAVLLRLWRDAPIPNRVRRLLLRRVNASFMVGAAAFIEDAQGRVLLLEHTYRRMTPWGLPGGFIHSTETPEQGLARELLEETGLTIEVGAHLSTVLFFADELSLLYRCRLVEGEFRPCAEVSAHGWFQLSALPPLPASQRAMLEHAGLLR